MAVCAAALALAACRGDARPPPAARQQAPPPAAAGRLELKLAVAPETGWNATEFIIVTINNGGAAAVPDARLNLFIQAPVVVLPDSAAAAPAPTAATGAAGTRLQFTLGTVPPGKLVEIRQRVRTPPAPVPAAPGQPRRAPGAKPDTATRFLVRAELARAHGELLALPAEDTLRIRAESAVVIGGCGNVSDAVVTRYGIGPVRVGMPLDALRAACPEARDTTWQQEGAKQTGIVVMPGGRRVLAVTADSTVSRIVIDQPGVKTAAGVQVGATVAELRGRFGRMCAGRAERQVAVWFPNQPGLSFGLDTAVTRGWTPARAEPDSVPDDVKVTSMWVRKGSDDCPARPGEGG
ncbi:MAG TPA: hypothetical protein VF541_02365 [Longimicrobium sp.]